MAIAITPSAAVMAGRARRSAAKETRIEWFIDKVVNRVQRTMKDRVRIATHLLKVKMVDNISVPVVKAKGPRGGTVVTERSKPGEFPRADTTQLMRTVFEDVRQTGRGIWDGFVGTPLSYGVILELRKNRSWMVRTLNEQRSRIIRILTGPMKT